MRFPTAAMVALLACSIFSVGTFFVQKHGLAQVTLEEDNNGSDSGSSGNSGETNVFIGSSAGVSIDALGVLTKLSASGAAELDDLRRDSMVPRLTASEPPGDGHLRKVSLCRLAKAAEVVLHSNSGGGLPDEMRYLAGLARVDFLLLYPESGDVVLAGSADDWVQMPNGHVLSRETGQPVLRLEDILAMLSAVADDSPVASGNSHSIDISRARLAKMQVHAKIIAGDPRAGRAFFVALTKSLDKQQETIHAVPKTTRFAPSSLRGPDKPILVDDPNAVDEVRHHSWWWD